MPKAIVLACILLATACKSGDKYDGPLANCSVSVGSCAPGAEHCGFRLGCDGRQLQVKCTPPAAGAKTMDCQCIENSVVGQSVQLVNPPQGDAREVAASACGWK